MAVKLYMDAHIPKAITNGTCVKDLEIIAQSGESEDMANRVEFLPL